MPYLLSQAAEALRDVMRPPKPVSGTPGRKQDTTAEAPPALPVGADTASDRVQRESAAADQHASRSDASAIDDAHRLVGRHADVPSQEPTQTQIELVRSSGMLRIRLQSQQCYFLHMVLTLQAAVCRLPHARMGSRYCDAS